MAIPDIDIFNELLSSLTLEEPVTLGEYDRIEAVPERILVDFSGASSSRSLWLWYRTSCTLTPSRLIEKVRKELQGKGHASGSDVALTLLAILCLRSKRIESPTTCLNAIIGAIGSAESSQYLIASFPPHPDVQEFKLGDFSIGPLNRQQLVYWCQKVGCDFFDRYPDKFRNRFAIVRSAASVQILDWQHIRDTFNISHSTCEPIVNYYFEVLTGYQQEVLRSDFRSAQEVYVAAGAPYIDLDQPQVWNGGSFISIFRNIGKKLFGYFCPLDMGVRIDFAQAHRRLPAKAQELFTDYSFTKIGKAEIHRTLETYCRFVVKAKVHENDARVDEAFLHYVIALDLLFGDKDASTQKVSKRAAMVTSRLLGETFPDTVERVRKIYDRRSRYVHAGDTVGDGALDSVRPIVNGVLFCLLRLQRDPGNKRDGFVDEWLKNLDYFVAAAEAGKDVPDQDLTAAGIATDGRAG